MKNRRLVLQALSAVALAGAFPTSHAQAPITLLNVSYDPTRELYVEFNAAFAKHWKTTTGQDVTIKQSHNRSTSSLWFFFTPGGRKIALFGRR